MEPASPQTSTSEQSEQTFKNDLVSVTVRRKPECVVELEVHAEPALIQTARANAVKAVRKEVVLPGFRKGKAPEASVVSKYTKEIDKEFSQQLGDLAFREAQTLAKIPLLRRDSRIQYQLKGQSEQGADMLFAFETFAQIPSVDPKKFQLTSVTPHAVGETEIEEARRQLGFFFAKWEEVTDRPAQEGDFVLLNVDVIDTDTPPRLFNGTRFEISERGMAKWMKSLVVGMSKGESKEGISEPDAELSDKEKEAYPPKKVRVTLNTIEKAILPPDETLFGILQVNSADELKASIARQLTSQAETHVKEKHREQVVEFLLKEYPCELPRSAIEQEVRFRMSQLFQNPEFKQEWEALSNEEKQKMLATIFEQSHKAVRLFHLCRKIIDDARLSISPEDIAEAPQDPLSILLGGRSDFYEHKNEEMRQAEAYSKLVLEKAEDYILSQI